MREIRNRYPGHEVQLCWIADGEHLDGCDHGDENFRPRAVITARFLGETIVREV